MHLYFNKRCRDLPRNAAVKVSDRPSVHGNEVGALGVLQHPHIVTIYGHGTVPDQDVSWMALEYCGGKDLTGVCGSSPDFKASCCVQILLALHHIHSKGYAHLDLKLGNAFLQGNGFVTVGDFGNAKKISDVDPADDNGTAGHQAQELLAGVLYRFGVFEEPNVFDPTKLDMFALGVLMYFLLLGSPPFDIEDYSCPATNEAIRQALEIFSANFRLGVGGMSYGDVPNITYLLLMELADYEEMESKLLAVCPPEFAALVMRLLSLNPLDRPSALDALQTPFMLASLDALVSQNAVRHLSEPTDGTKLYSDAQKLLLGSAGVRSSTPAALTALLNQLQLLGIGAKKRGGASSAASVALSQRTAAARHIVAKFASAGQGLLMRAQASLDKHLRQHEVGGSFECVSRCTLPKQAFCPCLPQVGRANVKGGRAAVSTCG